MKTALVIPSLGTPHLGRCLEAVTALDPAPDSRLVVLSGNATPPPEAENVDVHHRRDRLGFAAAVNAGLGELPADTEAIAILNDDALPCPEWLGMLTAELATDPGLAAVQGTSVDDSESTIDGRGITFDRWGLPVQIDHGTNFTEDTGAKTITAVSGTASLYRFDALREAAMPGLEIFDENFDCYHEDLDLGLRLTRRGWRSSWLGGAPVRHLGSATGPSFRWRHPWWVLANRWRALSGNLSRATLVTNMPRLWRGEIRSTHTLFRTNRRALPTALAVAIALPILIAYGWRRQTPGPRLESIPGDVG
jgi:GT2 family glycosyltransferase